MLVDRLAPDFNAAGDVERLLIAIADSLAGRAGAPRDNMFINQRAARSGRVFGTGDIVRCQAVPGRIADRSNPRPL